MCATVFRSTIFLLLIQYLSDARHWNGLSRSLISISWAAAKASINTLIWVSLKFNNVLSMSELWTDFEIREVKCDLNVSETIPRNLYIPLSLCWQKIGCDVFLTIFRIKDHISSDLIRPPVSCSKCSHGNSSATSTDIGASASGKFFCQTQHNVQRQHTICE